VLAVAAGVIAALALLWWFVRRLDRSLDARCLTAEVEAPFDHVEIAH
jgi:hypothetical protein